MGTGIKLIGLGFWVVAIWPGEKRPIGAAWGAERWTEDRLRGEFDRHPGAGIGICFGPGRGPGGSWLIDIEGDGPQAEKSLRKLLDDEDIQSMSWSSTRGMHWIFVVHGPRLLGALKTAGAKEIAATPGVYHLPELPDLEFRVGGFKDDETTVKQLQSVCPPTPGTDGKPRAWIESPKMGVSTLPEHAYTFLSGLGYGKAALEGETAGLAIKSAGERHAQLLQATLRLAGLVKAGKISERSALDSLYDAARSNGMAAEGRLPEVDEAWASAMGMATARKVKEPPQNGRHAPERNGPSPPRPRLAKLTISLEDVVPTAVDWLWEDRIAIGFITIFAGRTGMGKSFILCDVAARLSRGEPPPFSTLRRAPMRTVIVSEDPVNVMLGPRLIELEAVPSMIRFMTWEAMAIFSLDDQAMLDQLYEECGKPTLLVIDPPTNFIGDVDEHKNSEVRRMLMGLVKWLDEHKVACVLITHINKAIGKGLDAVERIVGSIAWGACARITIAFAKNPDTPGQLVCGGTKNNLGEIADPLDYQILKTEQLARIHWIGKSEVTIDDAINQIKKKSRGKCAVEWLTERFKEKREWESDDLRRLAAEYGISKNALWSEEVNALPISKRPRTNAQGDRYWLWIAQEGWPPGNVQPETREPTPDYRF